MKPTLSLLTALLPATLHATAAQTPPPSGKPKGP